jgi:hypothetical protein
MRFLPPCYPCKARRLNAQKTINSPFRRALFLTLLNSYDSFIKPSERIAVFDNDGTLWAEQPLYFQALFAFDQIAMMAPQHPEWKTEEPFASVLKGDIKGDLAGGEEALLKIIMASHSGMTTDEFSELARDWLNVAKHPKTQKPYTQMVYQPMLELLDYLRDNHFKTFIVSGGGIDFLRVFSEEVYGIPPEQVIGSSIKSEFKLIDGQPVITRKPELNFIDDKAGKPIGIFQHIGRRPIAAFGNSDGDLQMLQWTCLNRKNSLCALVHHTDEKREWAYDKKSSIGQLNKAIPIAEKEGWLLIDMKNEWEVIYPE